VRMRSRRRWALPSRRYPARLLDSRPRSIELLVEFETSSTASTSVRIAEDRITPAR
jgi:hypothetical protein